MRTIYPHFCLASKCLSQICALPHACNLSHIWVHSDHGRVLVLGSNDCCGKELWPGAGLLREARGRRRQQNSLPCAACTVLRPRCGCGVRPYTSCAGNPIPAAHENAHGHSNRHQQSTETQKSVSSIFTMCLACLLACLLKTQKSVPRIFSM